MMDNRYFRLARHWALFCPAFVPRPCILTDILEMFGTLIQDVFQCLFISFRVPYIEAKRKVEGSQDRRKEWGSQVLRSGKFCWVLGKLSGSLGEWDWSYNRTPLLREIVKKFLSKKALKGPVFLSPKVLVTGYTGLKSFKINVLQTHGTLVSTSHRCLWICCFF